MTKSSLISFLMKQPARVGNLVGFSRLGELHNKWIRKMISGKQDKTLLASRGTFKTTCVAVAIAILMIIHPNKRILFMRKTDGDVKEVVATVAKILKTPQFAYFVQVLYNVNIKLTTESATELTTNLTADIKGTPQLTGKGCGSSITGKHYDYIFTDDIVNIEDRISKAEREKTKLKYQELLNIVNRDGKIFNTGTPWHEEDCFSIMPEAERYDCYHPEVKKLISDEEREKLKGSMLPSLFAANYELRFIASENVIFTNPQKGAEAKTIHGGYMQVDSAFYGEDFTAWSIMAKHEGKYYLYGKMRRKAVDECYADILKDYEEYQVPKLYNEDNADKGMVAKEMRKLGMRVVTYHEGMNKYLKIVTYLKAIWKDLVFVEGTDDEYIKQICDYYEDAEHDDAPDSAASLARIMMKKGRNEEYQSLF